jgi:5-methylcytosine-specific restriction endonuclease McrA
MSSVLLLSSTYEPLRVISWQNAVCMFFLGKVEIVEEYDHHIRSVSVAIKAPAVVRLLRFFRAGRRSPPLSRANVLARDGFRCQYCNHELNTKEATLDHVVPRSQGGKTTWENIVCACAGCNRKKGGRTPKEAHMKLLSKPIKPDWLPVLNIKLHGKVPSAWHMFLQPAAKPHRS